MNKKCVWIMVISILIALVTAIIVRTSIIDISDVKAADLEKFRVMNGGSIREINLSLSDLINDSDVIVRGLALNERMYLHEATLTAFKVNTVYKGSQDIVGTNIYIFEPSSFNFEYKFFRVYDGYSLMKDGNEYILFLKKWRYTEYLDYNPYYKNKDIYILAHNSGIDKYNVNANSFSEIMSKDKKYYGQISQYDFYVYDKNEMDKYIKIKNEVLNYFMNTK
ncbi:hypothetical protein Y919_05775 [Caloranaerobacter azorensis H53214]|uniref:Uncharacterized protein n=1 Tax=Caloranaerobacter azorensis H53214 TaxID=1156417 RepID=A0A096BII8_9FIRM|nr:hypothetical protein [Caloranaerobacter azorensis]KGG80543.1 hypothetical protein Y919_05775 [Caloranaerobacter azorensis H53214]